MQGSSESAVLKKKKRL